MNDLQIFNNEEFGEVRTAVVNDEPMFCLIDICKALEIKNATDVAKRLDDDELTRLNLGSRAGETNFITESGQIQLLAQGYTELEQEVNNIKDDVSELKENVPLYSCDIDEIQQHVERRVVNILGGKQSEAYRDNSIRHKTFSDIWTQLKREYGCVSTYKSIKRKYIDDVHEFIDCYVVPKYLDELIQDANAQQSFA